MASRLEPAGDGLWTASAPLKLVGAEIGTRMTIAALDEGGLALISPVPIDDALAEEIDALGAVRAVIAPNQMHHLYLLDALERYPDAGCFMAHGVEKKLGTRPPGAVELGDEPDPLWKGVLEQVFVGGIPILNEHVFYHPRSKSLILTDLCFHYDPPPGGWSGIFLWLDGAYGKLAMSRLIGWVAKDRAAAREAIARILAWDFDAIVVTHGFNIPSGGKDRFAEATRSF